MLKEPYEANWLRVGCGQCSAVSMGACHLILTRLQPRRLPKAGREATRIPGEPLSALPPSTRNRGNIQGGFQERVGRVGRWVSHIFWRKVYKRALSLCDPKTVLLHVTRTNYEIMWDDKSEGKETALFANELLGLYAAQTGPCPRDKDIKDKWYSSWFKKSCVEKIQQLKDSGWNVMFSRDTAPAGGCKLDLSGAA